ncbi:hypothetical protein C8R46DRAFT_1121536, partial [Mycena filopes]
VFSPLGASAFGTGLLVVDIPLGLQDVAARIHTRSCITWVILRTTAQAVALEKVLEKNPDFGAFAALAMYMLSILKRTPSITDLFLSLSIWGRRRCPRVLQWLELINPRRVILFDDPRAEALALALGKSPSLQTLIMPVGRTFPEYLRPVTRLRSFTSLQIVMSAMMPDPLGLVTIHAIVDQDENLKAVVTYVPYDSDSFPNSAEAEDSRGSTLHELHLDFSKKPTGRGPKANPPFSSTPPCWLLSLYLRYISWAAHPKYSFSDPAPGSTILATPQSSAPLLGLCLHLPLPALREVILQTTNVPGHHLLLRKHGPKLTTLTVVFDHKATLPADFISCAAPHTALEYICFGAPYVCAAARKNKWIPLAKILLPAGIKLTDCQGTSARCGGPGGMRAGRWAGE